MVKLGNCARTYLVNNPFCCIIFLNQRQKRQNCSVNIKERDKNRDLLTFNHLIMSNRWIRVLINTPIMKSQHILAFRNIRDSETLVEDSEFHAKI